MTSPQQPTGTRVRLWLVVLGLSVVSACLVLDPAEYNAACDGGVCSPDGRLLGAAGSAGVAGGGAGGATGGSGGGAAGSGGGAAGSGGGAAGTGGGAAGSGGGAAGSGGGSAGSGGDAGRPLGAACSANTECAMGNCSDGVCCDSLCDGACNACNLPGSEGRCVGRSFGSDGVPSCGAYRCQGAMGGAYPCPVSCSSDAGCAPNAACVDGECLRPLSSLRDDFNGAAIDTSKWSPYTGPRGEVRQHGGAVHVTFGRPASQFQCATQGCYAGVFSYDQYDGLGSSATVTVTAAAGGGPLAAADLCVMALERPNEDSVSVRYAGGELHATVLQNAFATVVASAVAPTPPFRVRIREEAGVVYWEFADGGVSAAFTLLGSRAAPFSMRALHVELGAEQDLPQDAGVSFDDFNLP